MRILLLLGAIFWGTLLQACGQKTEKAYALMLKGLYKNTVPVISPDELQTILTAGEKAPLLLDTRQPAEFRVSHLSGARLIDYGAFEVEQLRQVPKNTPIILYCAVGYRSERVGEQLQEAGYTNVRHLYGGIFEWVNQGRPIYNAKGKTDQVHPYSEAWGVWLQKGEKVYGR